MYYKGKAFLRPQVLVDFNRIRQGELYSEMCIRDRLHYPFENKEIVDNRTYYPADFISEGVDQTRGWFFTLHAIATMVFDSVAYKLSLIHI